MKLEVSRAWLSTFAGLAGQDVLELLLPAGLRRLVARPRRIDRGLDKLETVDVARTVRENRLRLHPDDELRALEFGAHILEPRRAVHPEAPRLLEIEEEQADIRIDPDIAQAAEHAVAVVAWERQLVRRGNAHKTRQAALVGALRPAVLIRRGEEKHGA